MDKTTRKRTIESRLLAVILILLLSSCSYHATQKHIEWAEKVCAENGGLAYLETILFGKLEITPNAICNNGACFTGINTDFE